MYKTLSIKDFYNQYKVRDKGVIRKKDINFIKRLKKVANNK